MKTGSKGFFILGVIFIIVSFLWFSWVGNLPVGFIWLSIGILELVIGIVQHGREKKRQ